MGQGVNFYGSNQVFSPAKGDEHKVEPLHAFINGAHIVSCWRLSHGELAEVIESGCVYVAIATAALSPPPIFVGSESQTRRLVADDVINGGKRWERSPFPLPRPLSAVRFAVPAAALKLATTVEGTIECEVDGPEHVMVHVRTKREDAPELEAVDAFQQIERDRHIIARLSGLVEGAALALVDGKPLDSPELQGYLTELARATGREVVEVGSATAVMEMDQ